jgi:hypothetical protein
LLTVARERTLRSERKRSGFAAWLNAERRSAVEGRQRIPTVLRQEHDMNRLATSILLAAGLALPTGCANKQDQATENPGGAAGDAGSEDAAPVADRARGSSSTRGPGPRSGGRVKKFEAPKPMRVTGTDAQKPGGTETTAIEVTDVIPSMAAGGTAVEIFGSGFVEGVSVQTGGAAWEVVDVYDDRVVAKAPEGASGPVEVSMGSASGSSPAPFVGIAGTGFGTPAPTLNGLIGKVGAGSGAGQSDLGAADGTIAVPNLAVALDDGTQFGMADYSITFSGSLNVDTEGEYDLCITSDDGASLFVMDTLVIDNGGEHEAQEACELVYLEVGEYDIRVEYFNASKTPGAALSLEWAAPGGDLQPIPSEALFRPGR